MHLTRLRLTDFRAHASSELHPARSLNLVVGANGAGKTNLLEAISYLCLTKSFLAARDNHVVRRGANHFEVEGDFAGDARAPFHTRFVALPGEGKRAFINKAPLDRMVDLVGRAPVVVMSPGDRDLTEGGPIERRRFLDATLSQAFPVYLDDLVRYRRALRQRNALLQQLRRGRPLAPGSLDAWNEEVAVLGGKITSRRAEFVRDFDRYLSDAYVELGQPGDPLGMAYAPSVDLGNGVPAEESLRRGLARTHKRSQDTGRTFVGPHLDEVEFRVGGHDLRVYGSHGQHRTFSLAVRLGQALYLRETTDERPILLLDDVFGPLDPDRTRLVIDLLAGGGVGQSFITAASEEPFRAIPSFEISAHALFHVEQGEVTPYLPEASPPP